MSIHEPDEQQSAGEQQRRETQRATPAGARGMDTNEVVRKIRAGDEQQFTELYERVAPALYAWLHLRLGPAARRLLDPEDVVQEIWVRALRAFPRFDPELGSFRGWILKITKYELLDTFRGMATAARPTQEATAAGDGSISAADPAPRALSGLSQVPDHVTSFTQRIARDEDLQQLLEHVTELSEPEQALVVHCGLEGRPTSEAAALLGLNHEATRKRWLRLRASLRERAWVQTLFAESQA